MRLRARLDRHLIKGWRRDWHRLWSMRLAIGQVAAWSALGFLYAVWPNFVDAMPRPVFMGLGFAFAVAFGLGRLFKQKGTET